MVIVFRCTASEDRTELESIAAALGGTVLPETETHYPSIQVDNGTLPASQYFTNSGGVDAEEIIGGLSPQRPK